MFQTALIYLRLTPDPSGSLAAVPIIAAIHANSARNHQRLCKPSLAGLAPTPRRSLECRLWRVARVFRTCAG